MTEENEAAVIRFSATDILYLVDVDVASLDANDFIFA
jgi:hypothetical protein